MSFLIIDSDNNFTNQLSAQIAKEFNSEVHIKETASEAIALVELLDNFNFIIAIKSSKEEALADRIITFLDSKKQDLQSNPFLLLVGQRFTTQTDRAPLLLPLTVKISQLIQIIHQNKNYQKALDDMYKVSNKEYTPIPLGLFQYIKKSPLDVYLKMKKEGNDHILKRFSKGDTFEMKDIHSLSEKDIKSLYILKEEKLAFFKYIDVKLANLAKKHPEEFKDSEDLETYAFHSLTKIGISKSSLEVAKQATLDSTKKFEKDKKFQDSLKDIIKNRKLGLKQLNSKLISLLCFFITKGTEYEDNKVMSNLIMASYLQDIKIDNEYIKIRTTSELQSLYLDDSLNVLIDSHAALAATEVEKYDNIPMDVIKIVKHHHGSPSGKGFHYELPNYLFHQAVIFILAEEISFSILSAQREKLNFTDILESISLNYNSEPRMENFISNLKRNLAK